MTGNLRTARLTFARPVRRSRSARLRPGRPVPVLVRARRAGAATPAVVAGQRARPRPARLGRARVGAQPTGLAGHRGAACAWCRSISATARGRKGCACRPTTSARRRSSAPDRSRRRAPTSSCPRCSPTALLGGAYAVAVRRQHGRGRRRCARVDPVRARRTRRRPPARGLPGESDDPPGPAGSSSPGISCRPSSCSSSARSCRWLLRAGAPSAAGVAVWLVVGLIAWGLHRVRRLTHLHRW